jgi:hypothetical protein
MNEVTRFNNNTSYNADDGWGAVPTNDSGMIRGSQLRFNDGCYFINKSTEPVHGRELAVVGVRTAWTKWTDNKPYHRVTQPGQRHPERHELGDLDQQGTPNDPWRDSRYLYMIDRRTGEEFTFITWTKGGRKAVSDLKRQIENFRRAHPTAIPVVRLESEIWSTNLKPKPLLFVIDWMLGNASSEGCDRIEASKPMNKSAVADMGTPGDAPRSDPATNETSIQQEMDDEIPF